MIPVVTPDQMRAVEARYMAGTGLPSIDLMERAAKALTRVLGALPGVPTRVGIFACGRGGNGGDGYAAARLFAEKVGKAIIVPLAADGALSHDARVNAARARATAGVAFASVDDLDRLPVPAVWVDAMQGIGLTRPLEGDAVRLVRRMAQDKLQGAHVVAVDIASGLDGLTGRALGDAVCATATVTFGWPKPGHLLEDGLDQTGALTVAPIGIGDEWLPGDALSWAQEADLHAHMKPRARNTHKGHYGHLLLVAGSVGMAGAAILAARGALHSGVGLLTLAVPEPLIPIVQTACPCAMALPLPAADPASALQKALAGKTALAIGPGLSQDADPALVRAVLDAPLPAVLDADALNLIARDPALLARLTPRHVITPHPGEAARLLGAKIDSALSGAAALRALGPVALLKGAGTVIHGERVTIRASGCAGLAKGGTGDVLTGAIGAFLAQGIPPERVAILGAVAHGAAGERAAAQLGEVGMTAEDVADALKQVFKHG